MKFLALGGTNYVGASSYYVELDGTRLLLDCGKGICRSRSQVFSPAFASLLTGGCLQSLGQLDGILLSHAHFDHIAAIDEITHAAPDTPVFATRLTKELADHLLFDRSFYWESDDILSDFKQKFAVSEAIDRIQQVGYHQTFCIGSVNVTFFEAGHVPGGAAIYLQAEEGSVLYTGDYMLDRTILTPGLQLPDWVKPNVVILNGLHANHPTYRPKRTLLPILHTVQDHAASGTPLHIQVHQLTKGVELVALFKQAGIFVPIFLDDAIYSLAQRMSYAGVPILTQNCQRLPPCGSTDGIVLSSRKMYRMPHIKADFSLHGTFWDDLTLLTRLQPQVVYLVHAPNSAVAEIDSLQNHFAQTSIICPKQGQLYTNSVRNEEYS